MLVRLVVRCARPGVKACFWLASLFLIAFAQQPDPPGFDVATIKPSRPETAGPVIGISAGRITLTSFTLKELMGFAYQIQPNQVVGSAGWADSDKFDIVAQPEKGFVSFEDDSRKMLQTLLADRFQLKFHHDTKELPAYVLSIGKNGQRMKARAPGDGGSGFRLVFQGASLPGRNASMAQLAFVLQIAVMDRPVLDKTGLTGNFDFDLSWAPNETQFGGRGAKMAADPDSPDLFTAMQEQLGLKLEARKVPVDVLMIGRKSPIRTEPQNKDRTNDSAAELIKRIYGSSASATSPPVCRDRAGAERDVLRARRTAAGLGGPASFLNPEP